MLFLGKLRQAKNKSKDASDRKQASRHKDKKKSSSKSIFRKSKSEEPAPSITLERVLTTTLSDDEKDKSYGSIALDVPSKPEAFAVKTPEAEAVDVEPQQEAVVAAKSPEQEAIETTLTFTEKQVMDYELNHMRQLQAKQEELNKLKAELEAEKSAHEQQLNEMQTKLDKSQEEVKELEGKLDQAKSKLNIVSSTLMQCQRELFERKSQFFRLW